MNEITNELLRRRSSLIGKRRRFLMRQRKGAVKGSSGGATLGVTVTALTASPTNAATINFTVTFAQSVTGFAAADIQTSASTVGGTLTPVVTGSGAVYNVAITGQTGTGLVIMYVKANSVLDTLTGQIPNSQSNPAFVVYDSVQPSVTIAKSPTQPDPTSTAPVTFLVTFSESVTGFTSFDISFTGSTAGTLFAAATGAGSSYSVDITGMSVTGSISVTVPASAAADAAGNLSTASNTATCAWVQPAPGSPGQMDFSKAANSGLLVLLFEDF